MEAHQIGGVGGPSIKNIEVLLVGAAAGFADERACGWSARPVGRWTHRSWYQYMLAQRLYQSDSSMKLLGEVEEGKERLPSLSITGEWWMVVTVVGIKLGD